MADDFVTPAELSVWTGGKILSTDPRLPGLLAGAAAGIRRYCGWHIYPAVEESLTLDGPGGDILPLPTMFLSAVDSVTEDGTVLDVWDQGDETGDFEWSANGEVRRLGAWWTERFRGVVVEVTHGYASAPADIAQVVMQVCASALSSPMGATREQAIGFAATWAMTAPGVAGGMSLLGRDLAVLDLYRMPGVV